MNFIKASIVLGQTQLRSKLLNSRSTCIPLMVTSSTHRVGTVPASKLDTASANDTEWTTIYRLPLVRLVAAFNRLKVLQAMVVSSGIPAMYALEKTTEMPPNLAISFAAIGVTGFLTLILCSYFFQNIIGFIYINDERDQLKLAYVDFWGRRKHAVVNIKDILPPWDQPRLKYLNFFHSIQTVDKKKTYKLVFRFGQVLDPEVFTEIFGE